MKKIKLVLALLPLVALTGCNKEETWRNDARSISVYTAHQSYNYQSLSPYSSGYYLEINYIVLSGSSIKIKTKSKENYYKTECFSNVEYIITYK